MDFIELGLYILDEEFLDTYYLKDYPQNKKDGERPFFACFQDNKNKDIYWCIPISSKVDKYKKILEKHPNAGVITKLYGDKNSVILTQNVFPIHKKYIKRQFILNGCHFKILDKSLKKSILKKARYMRSLLMHNKHYYSDEIINLYHIMSKVET